MVANDDAFRFEINFIVHDIFDSAKAMRHNFEDGLLINKSLIGQVSEEGKSQGASNHVPNATLSSQFPSTKKTS